MSFFARIKKDPQYKRYRRIYKTTAERLDIEDHRREALSLYQVRKVRELIGKNVFSAKRISEATGVDLATRSRLVELRERTTVQITILQATIKKLHRYIMTEYQAEMRGFTNAVMRAAALDRITAQGTDLVTDAEAFLAMIDIFVKDIDQAKFSTRDMVEVLKLLDSSKGRIV